MSEFYDIECVATLLDELLRVKRKQVLASVNAGACGTSSDFRAAHEAEIEMQETYERVRSDLVSLLAQARKTREAREVSRAL